jgi:tetratricopeptide (TPR) repeat protein
MLCYEKALELDSSNEWALNNIASLLKDEGKRKESLKYYKLAYKKGDVLQRSMANI